MENAVDALYMGAAMLIFVIALTISISSFGNVKRQVDEIVSNEDKINYALENGEFINFIKANQSVRIVHADAVISTIRRIQEEDYDIYLCLKNPADLYIPDLSMENVLINGVNKNVFKISLSGKVGQVLDSSIMKVIYSSIKDKEFQEYLGMYKNASLASDANKKTNRLITFVENT